MRPLPSYSHAPPGSRGAPPFLVKCCSSANRGLVWAQPSVGRSSEPRGGALPPASSALFYLPLPGAKDGALSLQTAASCLVI